MNDLLSTSPFPMDCENMMDEIQNLLKHSEKDKPLSRKLHSELNEILLEDPRPSQSQNKYSQVLLIKLVNFRKHILRQMAESFVIQNSRVTLIRINPLKTKRQKFDQKQTSVAGPSSSITVKEEKYEDLTDTCYNDLSISNHSEIKMEEENRCSSMNSNFHSFHSEEQENNGESDCDNGKELLEFKSELTVNEVDEVYEKEEEGEQMIQSQQNVIDAANPIKNEFPCSICNKIFHKKGHMTRHLLTHAPEKPFPCEFIGCSARFAAKYTLRMHMINVHQMSDKPFECTKCNKRFNLPSDLDKHDARIHHHNSKLVKQIKLKSKLTPKPIYKYNCLHCNKSFQRKYNLTRHERIHNPVKPFHCNTCGGDFSTKYGFRGHLQIHEQNAVHKPLVCPICSKQFAEPQALEIHVLFHTDSQNTYPCELCEVRFSTAERLKLHVDSHGSPEGRYYPCQYCDRIFPRKYNLERHELSHTHGRRRSKTFPFVVPVGGPAEQQEDLLSSTSSFQSGEEINESNDSSNYLYESLTCEIPEQDDIDIDEHMEFHEERLSIKQEDIKPEVFYIDKGENPDSISDIYLCLNCGETFTEQIKLQQHHLLCNKPQSSDLITTTTEMTTRETDCTSTIISIKEESDEVDFIVGF